ncbi:MAG: SsrA-binding protein SmpB [Armatimonadota bacterium]
MKKEKKSQNGEEIRVVAANRRARHDYFIDETYEAGIALVGMEVKSIRDGRLSLQDSYAEIKDGEAWLYNMHISPYPQAHRFNPEPNRPRKLLLHRKEIDRLRGKLEQRGYTLIPLSVYFKRGRVKIELGLARGKRQYDKRRAIAEREARRELERALSGRE